MRCPVLKRCSKALHASWRGVNHELVQTALFSSPPLPRSFRRDSGAPRRKDRGTRCERHAEKRSRPSAFAFFSNSLRPPSPNSAITPPAKLDFRLCKKESEIHLA